MKKRDFSKEWTFNKGDIRTPSSFHAGEDIDEHWVVSLLEAWKENEKEIETLEAELEKERDA